MTDFRRIAVLGPGVLGGSIALALRQRHPERCVVLWGRNPDRVEHIRNSGLAEVTARLDEALEGAELVILAVPVDSLGELGQSLLEIGLADGVCITDVGSVKVYPHATLGRLMDSRGISFLGSHPMAGSEKTGFKAAHPDLFAGAACILTNEHHLAKGVVRQLSQFWEDLGSNVSVMSAQEHDRLVGRISHLPHVLSTICALEALRHPEDGRYSGKGLRDTSRVAAGDPSMWAEILLQNRSQITSPLREAASELLRVADQLENEDRAAILKVLTEGQRRRNTLDREE